MVSSTLKKEGLILSDNALWSGKVTEPLDPKDKSTKVLFEYSSLLKTNREIDTLLLPIRDVTISRKK